MANTKVPQHLTELSTLYGFGPQAVGKTDVDFNTMTNGGIYSVLAAGSSNGPYGTGANAGFLQVLKTPGGAVRQIWRDYDSMEIWERYLVTDTWSAWERTYVSGASLVEAAGYQKLPSGLIVQWGFYSGGGARTVTLTNILGKYGRTMVIAKNTSDGNTLTIAAASGETINGSATYSTTTAYAVVTLIGIENGWVIA